MGQGNSAYWLTYGPDNWGMVIGLQAGESSFFFSETTRPALGPTQYACCSPTWSTRWRSWLRQFSTRRKVAGSIFYGVTGIFHRRKPSVPTMALGSTQPSSTNVYQKYFLRGKGGRCIGLTTLPLSMCLKLLEPSGPVQTFTGIALPFYARLISSLTTSADFAHLWSVQVQKMT